MYAPHAHKVPANSLPSIQLPVSHSNTFVSHFEHPVGH